MLIGIDVWSAHWKQNRIVLKVRGDNVGALTLLLKMRPSSPSMAIVSRELALRLVELSFPPDAVHTWCGTCDCRPFVSYLRAG